MRKDEEKEGKKKIGKGGEESTTTMDDQGQPLSFTEIVGFKSLAQCGAKSRITMICVRWLTSRRSGRCIFSCWYFSWTKNIFPCWFCASGHGALVMGYIVPGDGWED